MKPVIASVTIPDSLPSSMMTGGGPWLRGCADRRLVGDGAGTLCWSETNSVWIDGRPAGGP
jgi:hypothetical protein